MSRSALTLAALIAAASSGLAANEDPAARDTEAAPVTSFRPLTGNEQTLEDFLRDPAIAGDAVSGDDDVRGVFVFCIDVPTAIRKTETITQDTWQMVLEYNPDTQCNELTRRLVPVPYQVERIVVQNVKRRFRIPMTARVAQVLQAELCDGEEGCCDLLDEIASPEAPYQTDYRDEPTPVDREATPERTERPSLDEDAAVVRPAASEWITPRRSTAPAPIRRVATR